MTNKGSEKLPSQITFEKNFLERIHGFTFTGEAENDKGQLVSTWERPTNRPTADGKVVSILDIVLEMPARLNSDAAVAAVATFVDTKIGYFPEGGPETFTADDNQTSITLTPV